MKAALFELGDFYVNAAAGTFHAGTRYTREHVSESMRN